MTGRPDWRTMTRADFQADAREVQGALFPVGDPAGTGDLVELLTAGTGPDHGRRAAGSRPPAAWGTARRQFFESNP